MLQRVGARPTLRKVLLACGVISSVWWTTVDVIASLRYPGYSYTNQIISELSAEGAPTRAFWLSVNSVPYAVLAGAFGVGVLTTGRSPRSVKISGILLILHAIIGLVGGVLFPMAMRGEDGTLRNAMHVPYGLVSVLLFLLMMYFGAKTFGTRFRYYSYVSILILLVSGTFSGMQSGRMVEGGATPWMGVEERISVYIAMLWIAVLAIALLRVQVGRSQVEPVRTRD